MLLLHLFLPFYLKIFFFRPKVFNILLKSYQKISWGYLKYISFYLKNIFVFFQMSALCTTFLIVSICHNTNSSSLTNFRTFSISCTAFVVMLVSTFDFTFVVFGIIGNFVFKPFILRVTMMRWYWMKTGVEVAVIQFVVVLHHVLVLQGEEVKLGVLLE